MTTSGKDDHEIRFHRAMLVIYERALTECKYPANRFLTMVSNDGGLKTAKKLLRAPIASDGFFALWQCGRLDLTVEALVLKPEWRNLFDDLELRSAESRLHELGYTNTNHA